MLSTVTFTGNVTADPELRHTPSGTPVASFTVAVNEDRRNKETGKLERVGTTYWKCTVWKNYAVNVAATMRKGDHVLVVGEVKEHTYTAKDGTKRSSKEIEVEDVGLTWRFAAED